VSGEHLFSIPVLTFYWKTNRGIYTISQVHLVSKLLSIRMSCVIYWTAHSESGDLKYSSRMRILPTIWCLLWGYLDNDFVMYSEEGFIPSLCSSPILPMHGKMYLNMFSQNHLGCLSAKYKNSLPCRISERSWESVLKKFQQVGMVKYVCYPSYLGGSDLEHHSSRPIQAKG
jgi:hypothetical protein